MAKTYVTQTFIRLLREADKKGYLDRRQDRAFKEVMKYSKIMASKKPEKLIESMVIVITNEFTEHLAKVRVEMAIHRRIMTVLMKWLSEGSERQARRELSAIRIKDVLKS